MGRLMKLCITALGLGLDALIDPRFDRCQYFTFIDTDTMEFESIPNLYFDNRDAGIQSAGFVASRGVKVVLTAEVSPKAYHVLTAAGIDVFTGISGTVREVIEKYKRGKLPTISMPDLGPVGRPQQGKA